MIAGGKKIELQIKKICWDLLFYKSIIRYKIMEKTLTPVCKASGISWRDQLNLPKIGELLKNCTIDVRTNHTGEIK